MTSQVSDITSKSSLMDLFQKRTPQPLVQPKPTKKIKISQQNLEDPMYKVLSWRDELTNYILPEPGTYKLECFQTIEESDQTSWGSDYHAIFLNVDWETTTMQQFQKLKLDKNLMNNGIVFVWGNKTNIGQLIDFFQTKDMMYVQNFVFSLLDRTKIQTNTEKKVSKGTLFNFFKKNQDLNPENDQIENKPKFESNKDYEIGKISDVKKLFFNSPSQYFKSTQKVLYMFRILNKQKPLQLRHQRTSDAFFTIGDDQKLDFKSNEIVYQMIETLLVKSKYQKKNQIKFLEVWGNSQRPRKGWATVCQKMNK